MILTIPSIPEGHSEVDQSTGLESVKDQLPKMLEPVKCHAELDRTGANIFVHLWYSGSFELECSRCLISFPLAVSGELRLVLQEKPGHHGEAPEDDVVNFYFDNQKDVLDISSAIFDEAMIAMPLKPLCREDCKGIEIKTSDVQVELHEDGSKREKPIDPRWEALKKLQNKKSEDNDKK